jgi:hypothetical protein
VEVLRRADPPSKQCYQISKRFIISEAILKWNGSQSQIRIAAADDYYYDRVVLLIVYGYFTKLYTSQIINIEVSEYNCDDCSEGSRQKRLKAI